MPFYIRKSVSAGPFRFNFSKGGVGVSVGVKGLRIGTGPKGHYIHAGRGGLYYRASLEQAGTSGSIQPTPVHRDKTQPIVFDTPGVKMVEIESGNVELMRDVTFSNLLDEIRTKQSQARMAHILLTAGALLSATVIWIFGVKALPICILTLVAWGIGLWLDSFRRTTVLFYDLDQYVEQRFTELTKNFDAMANCGGKWHVEAGGAVNDLTTWKRNAGASHIVRKKPNVLEYKLPDVIRCNITPPAIHVGKQIIYFFPDVMLIEDKGHIGAVGYTDLQISYQNSNFIEEGKVPHDAQIVDYTWRHPNKSGGPDRRFKNNHQIPICRYEVMHLSSRSGVNELIEFSRTGVCRPFAEMVRSLPKQAVLQGNLALPNFH